MKLIMNPDKLAEEIDTIKLEIANYIVERRRDLGHADSDNLVYGLALMLLAANHTIHDNAKYEDYIALCNAAWDKSVKIHKTCIKRSG